jgi:hypothetical protein
MNALKLYQKTLLCTAIVALLIAIPNQAKAEENIAAKNESIVPSYTQADLNYQKKLKSIEDLIQRFDKLADEKISNKIFFDDEIVNFEKDILGQIDTLNNTDKGELKKKVEKIHAKIEEQLESYKIYLRVKYYKSFDIVAGQIDTYSKAASEKMTNRDKLDGAKLKADQIDKRILDKLRDSDKMHLLDKINATDTRLIDAEEDITDVENEILKYKQDRYEVNIICSRTTDRNDNITNLVLKNQSNQPADNSVEKRVVSIIDENINSPFIQTKPGDDSQLILAKENKTITKDPAAELKIHNYIIALGSYEDITVEFIKDEACMDTTLKVLVEEDTLLHHD